MQSTVAAVEIAPGVGLEGDGSERAAASFTSAFPALYRHAYRVAYRLLGSASEAEELAQEALARAYQRWAKVSEYVEPEGWVTRVVSNLVFDLSRRRKRERLLAEHAVPGPDADRLDLYRALADLSRRQRQVVVLRYVADLPESAVAEALGCSRGAVKQHASRGLAALRMHVSMQLPEAK